MAVSPPSHSQILHTYRHLYRHLLQAVRYSVPSRYVVRDELREAFRKGKAGDYDHDSVLRTLEFLRGAAACNGLEHQILKNLVHAKYFIYYNRVS